MHFPAFKLPKLTVSFDDDNAIYSVATFSSEEKAQWFIEAFVEMFISRKSDEKA